MPQLTGESPRQLLESPVTAMTHASILRNGIGVSAPYLHCTDSLVGASLFGHQTWHNIGQQIPCQFLRIADSMPSWFLFN